MTGDLVLNGTETSGCASLSVCLDEMGCVDVRCLSNKINHFRKRLNRENNTHLFPFLGRLCSA